MASSLAPSSVLPKITPFSTITATDETSADKTPTLLIPGGEYSQAHLLARWVVNSKDNNQMPYVVIDKRSAHVLVFDATGVLLGAQPALLGMEKGDVDPPNIGKRSLSAIGPSLRITPAGRFVASLGVDLKGQEMMWLDYEASLALHPVTKGTPQENRRARLLSPSAADNRISYGCINVPTDFYKSTISPTFAQTNGVVYIMPETADPIVFFGGSQALAGTPISQN